MGRVWAAPGTVQTTDIVASLASLQMGLVLEFSDAKNVESTVNVVFLTFYVCLILLQYKIAKSLNRLQENFHLSEFCGGLQRQCDGRTVYFAQAIYSAFDIVMKFRLSTNSSMI